MKKSRAMPDRKPFLTLLQQALENIREDQLFNDERGFQGALLQELGRRLPDGVRPEDPMLQQEYQKRMLRHRIRIRPDIIIHVQRQHAQFQVFLAIARHLATLAKEDKTIGAVPVFDNI